MNDSNVREGREELGILCLRYLYYTGSDAVLFENRLRL